MQDQARRSDSSFLTGRPHEPFVRLPLLLKDSPEWQLNILQEFHDRYSRHAGLRAVVRSGEEMNSFRVEFTRITADPPAVPHTDP